MKCRHFGRNLKKPLKRASTSKTVGVREGSFQTDNGRIGLEISECLTVFDAQGAFCPTLDTDCRLGFEADSVIVAIGQRPTELALPTEYVQKQPAVDPVTLQSEDRSESVFQWRCADRTPFGRGGPGPGPGGGAFDSPVFKR